MTSNIKYIGLDVHKESISICVRNSVGKVVMESVIETKAISDGITPTAREARAAALIRSKIGPNDQLILVPKNK